MSALSLTQVGGGRPLFVVPGWAMPAAVLEPWAEGLTGWRVTVVDLPGQGASFDRAYDLDSLARELAAAAPAEAVWLGWSLGATLALQAAAHRRPKALLLVSGNPRFLSGADWAGVAPADLAALTERLEASPEAAQSHFLRLLAAAGTADRRAARLIRRTVPPCDGREGLASGLAVLEETDLCARLAELDVPALWLAGNSDPLIPVGAVEAAAAAMPNGRCRFIDGCGHLPFWTHPTSVTAALADLAPEDER